MGMIGKLFMVSAEAAEQLVDDPTGVLALLGLDDELDEKSATQLDLQKTWHGLHFLLTDDAGEGEAPLNFFVAGGEEIGIDLGSGQVRLFDAAAVQRIDGALAGLSRAELISRLDPSAFEEADIYGANWDEPLDELQEEYGDAFDRMKAFVHRAAGSGQSLVTTIL